MEINVLQILPNSTIVRCENDLLKLLFNTKVSELSKVLNLPIKNVSRYKTGTRGMPLRVFNKLCELNKLNLGKFQNKIRLKINPTGTEIKLGPYLKIDENWIYVAELIRGDGHITNNYWAINFVNKEKILVSYVAKFFSKLGVPKRSIYLYNRSDGDLLTIRSFVFAYLFSAIFKIPTGAKNDMNLPNFIYSNRRFMIAAVRGAFDAEGSVQHRGSRRISIASNSQSWASDIQTSLEKLGIKCSLKRDISSGKRPIYRLYIFHQINLAKFLKVISPYHSKREKKLKEVLSSYSDQNPVGFWRNKILLAIKEGYAKRKEIALRLKISKRTVGNYLWWLSKNELISPSKKVWTNKGAFYEYELTRKGLEYLNSSHSFFD